MSWGELLHSADRKRTKQADHPGGDSAQGDLQGGGDLLVRRGGGGTCRQAGGGRLGLVLVGS